MSPQVIPISMTKVDWPNFLKEVEVAENRNITAKLSNARTPFDSPKGYVVALNNLKDASSDVESVLRFGPNSLQHFHFGFLVIADEDRIWETAEALGVASVISQSNTCLVVTANLLDWKQKLIATLHVELGYPLQADTQRILNLIVVFLEQASLFDLFYGYRKIGQSLFRFESYND